MAPDVLPYARAATSLAAHRRRGHPRGARFSSDAAQASGMCWQVVSGTGASVSPTNGGPSDVVSAS